MHWPNLDAFFRERRGHIAPIEESHKKAQRYSR
jgi:hypothetical protein